MKSSMIVNNNFISLKYWLTVTIMPYYRLKFTVTVYSFCLTVFEQAIRNVKLFLNNLNEFSLGNIFFILLPKSNKTSTF